MTQPSTLSLIAVIFMSLHPLSCAAQNKSGGEPAQENAQAAEVNTESELIDGLLDLLDTPEKAATGSAAEQTDTTAEDSVERSPKLGPADVGLDGEYLRRILCRRFGSRC